MALVPRSRQQPQNRQQRRGLQTRGRLPGRDLPRERIERRPGKKEALTPPAGAVSPRRQRYFSEVIGFGLYGEAKQATVALRHV